METYGSAYVEMYIDADPKTLSTWGKGGSDQAREQNTKYEGRSKTSPVNSQRSRVDILTALLGGVRLGNVGDMKAFLVG